MSAAAGRAEIQLQEEEKKAEIRNKEIEKENQLIEDRNQKIIDTADLASDAIASGFLEFAKGNKSAGDAVLGSIGDVSNAIFKSLAQQVTQQKITDRLTSAGFIQQKAAEVSASTAQAGLNAFVATSGAPFPLNLAAPAAAATASATAASIGSSVISAASAREQGGNLDAGQASTFAERGEIEVLTPASNSRIRTANQLKGIMGESQSSPQVSVVVIDQTPSNNEVEASTDDEGRTIILIREIVSGDVGDPNSQIRKSFANSTNLQSAGR